MNFSDTRPNFEGRDRCLQDCQNQEVNVSGRKEELAAPVSTDSAKMASLLTLAKRFIFICALFRCELLDLTK
jgi:hypothetical protein